MHCDLNRLKFVEHFAIWQCKSDHISYYYYWIIFCESVQLTLIWPLNGIAVKRHTLREPLQAADCGLFNCAFICDIDFYFFWKCLLFCTKDANASCELWKGQPTRVLPLFIVLIEKYISSAVQRYTHEEPLPAPVNWNQVVFLFIVQIFFCFYLVKILVSIASDHHWSASTAAHHKTHLFFQVEFLLKYRANICF